MKKRTVEEILKEVDSLQQAYLLLERNGDMSNIDPKDPLSKTNPVAHEAFRLYFIHLNNEIVSVQSKGKHD